MKMDDFLKKKKNLPKENLSLIEGTLKGIITTYDPEDSEMFKGCK